MKGFDCIFSGNVEYDKEYSEFGRDLYQTEIDRHFEFANNYYRIEFERDRGSNRYETLGVRIEKTVDPNTGNKLSDDFKTILFQKDEKAEVGAKLKFCDNIWLSLNASRILVNSYSLICRRCNNNLTFKINGEIYQEPCVIEYGSSSGTLEEKIRIMLPDKNIKVIVQNNDLTKKVKINNRFIFGTQVFKVTAIMDYEQNSTLIGDNGIIVFNMVYDPVSALDDMSNKVAEEGVDIMEKEGEENIMRTKIKVEEDKIKLSPDKTYVKEGETIQYKVMLEGENITEKCNISLETKIPESYYTFKVNAKTFKIGCVQKIYNEKLKVKVEYEGRETIFNIGLKGLF